MFARTIVSGIIYPVHIAGINCIIKSITFQTNEWAINKTKKYIRLG